LLSYSQLGASQPLRSLQSPGSTALPETGWRAASSAGGRASAAGDPALVLRSSLYEPPEASEKPQGAAKVVSRRPKRSVTFNLGTGSTAAAASLQAGLPADGGQQLLSGERHAAGAGEDAQASRVRQSAEVAKAAAAVDAAIPSAPRQRSAPKKSVSCESHGEGLACIAVAADVQAMGSPFHGLLGLLLLTAPDHAVF
jgi:hypothetical protein